tara:strand:- start:836 stop:1177 length:342 start_codon:yes stop_codon:yes gene_type:complete
MALKLGNHLFYGPFLIEKVNIRQNQTPVIFAIVSKSGEAWNPEFRLVDAGASGEGGLILSAHPNFAQWHNQVGELQVYLLDVRGSSAKGLAAREKLAKEIAEFFAPPDNIIPL